MFSFENRQENWNILLCSIEETNKLEVLMYAQDYGDNSKRDKRD